MMCCLSFRGLPVILLLPFAAAQFFISGATGFAQSKPNAPMESPQDLSAKLTPEQRQQFENGMRAFNAKRYADALTNFNTLLKQLPGDALLSKFAGDSALNMGDQRLALTLVEPVVQADPGDWQAAAILTRACAESGNKTCRNNGMAHMLDLHQRGVAPQRMRDYVLEQIKLGANTLEIRTSLEPWGNYKVYNLGQVSDAEGHMFLQITLESNDEEQARFIKQYPKEAADGQRQFSLDAYRETGFNSSGQRTQTHYSYKFFIGQPAYDTIREEFIKVANGTSKPMSSRSDLIVNAGNAS
jgi:tetratricopeptide (TPR) repeat protein